MVKLIVLYRHPEDPQSFNEHYEKVHTPLTLKMPGLKKMEVTRITGTPMGDQAPYYLQAAMYFEDRQALDAAMRSEEGKAAAKDLMGFASKLVTMMIGEVSEQS